MKATVFRVHLGGHFVSPAPQWLGFEFPNFPVLVVPWYPMLSDKSLHAQFRYLSIVQFMFIHAHWCFFTLLLCRLGKTHEKRHLDISSFSSHEMQKTLFHCVLISPWMFGVFCFTPVGDKLVDPVLPIEMWWQIRGFFQGEKPVAALCLKHQLVYTFCDGWSFECLRLLPQLLWSFPPANLTESHRSATDRNFSSQCTLRRRRAYGRVDATGALTMSP